MGRDRQGFLTVAIIGGGFSGATLAAQLLRAGNSAVSVVLIGREDFPGRGVAYSTECDGHLLNVPAGNMSALADDPGHFLRWARLHFDSAVQAGDFLPRRTYGQYVESILREARENCDCAFEWKQDEAVSLTRAGGRTEVLLRSGDTVKADKVVLALGNFPPGDLNLPGKIGSSARYVPNGWQQSTFDNVDKDENILLIGSGLTSVDVAISLRAQNFEGTIHVVSRHGLLPQHHKPTLPWRASWNQPMPSTARQLLRLVRAKVREAENQGSDWRAVIDSLRPVTQQIWQSLPIEEQQRFLRHLRSYWDVHRHRVAPEIGAMLASELRDHRIQVHAGRIVEYRDADHSVKVTYRDRHSGESRTLRVSRVINCTGPDSDCRRVTNSLLKDLIQQKTVRPDPLFLGLDTADDGALIAGDGAPSHDLYAIGPLRKGNLWETIAVPELRVQVSVLAARLLASAEPSHLEAVAPEDATIRA